MSLVRRKQRKYDHLHFPFIVQQYVILSRIEWDALPWRGGGCGLRERSIIIIVIRKWSRLKDGRFVVNLNVCSHIHHTHLPPRPGSQTRYTVPVPKRAGQSSTETESGQSNSLSTLLGMLELMWQNCKNTFLSPPSSSSSQIFNEIWLAGRWCVHPPPVWTSNN